VIPHTSGGSFLRLKGLIEEGQAAKEIAAELAADEVAAMLVSVIQGGYVLASAAGSAKPFNQAIRGALSLLS
jgi:TetR/AcrR family transcriptional regulator, transcriptional repressor for nem operon